MAGSGYIGLTWFCKYDSLLNMCCNASMGCQISAHVNITQGSEYAWMWLNNAWINCSDLSNYGRVLNMSEAYPEHCQRFKTESCAKRIVPECRHITKSFESRGGFMELGYFNKHFVKNTSEKLCNYTTTFWMENLSQRWTQ